MYDQPTSWTSLIYPRVLVRNECTNNGLLLHLAVAVASSSSTCGLHALSRSCNNHNDIQRRRYLRHSYIVCAMWWGM